MYLFAKAVLFLLFYLSYLGTRLSFINLQFCNFCSASQRGRNNFFRILFLPDYKKRHAGGSFKTLWRPEEQQLGQMPLKMSTPTLKCKFVLTFLFKKHVFRRFISVLRDVDAPQTHSDLFGHIS